MNTSDAPAVRVLFVVPFIHTNMTPLVAALTSGGVSVTIVCPPGDITHAPTTATTIERDPHAMTSEEADELVAELAPDLVVLRATEGRFPSLARSAQRRGARAVFYNQAPFRRERGAGPASHDLLKLVARVARRLPVRRITPVAGPPDGRPTLMTKHLPFPMPVTDGADHRRYAADGTPTVLCVGKLDHPRKRHDWLLDAAEEIDSRARLIIAGSGPRRLRNNAPTREYPQGKATGYRQYYERLVERCQDAGRPGPVELLHDVPYADMPALYATCDVFVLPATREPFAISPLEAMAAGAAVVISDANGALSYVTDGVDGMVFDAGCYEDFRDRLGQLLASPGDIERLGRAAVATVRERHNPAHFPDWFREEIVT